jgi:hypothetical protein
MPTNTYSIRVESHLRPEWSAWFDGMTVTHEPGGHTTISGPVADQSALHGLIIKVRDLGLVLVSIQRLDTRPG